MQTQAAVEALRCLAQRLRPHRFIVFVGEPGVGKTTLALNLVAADLLDRERAKTWREAQERAAQYLYLHESPETLVAELLKIAESGGRDYIIIDDAAIGFFDLGPKVWSALMDAIKVARESLVKGWLIFTTTNTHFISRRVTASAKLVHLVRRREVSLAPHRSGCLYILDDYTRGALYTDEAVEAVELIHSVRYVSSPQWHVAHPAMMSRTLTAVPRVPDLAMPTAVEKAHLEARRRRVTARLQEVLEFLHSRREEEGEEGGAGG